jgi:hypothetical protein
LCSASGWYVAGGEYDERDTVTLELIQCDFGLLPPGSSLYASARVLTT